MTQLSFDLGHRTALGREDFLVGPSNELAVAWIDRWPDWPQPVLTIYGASGSGKTHLAEVWRHASGALPLVKRDLLERDPAALVAARKCVIFDAIDAVVSDATDAGVSDAIDTSVSDAIDTSVSDAIDTSVSDAIDTSVFGSTGLEESLLHLYNHLREAGGSLLLTAERPPAQWPIRLADLRSRLAAASAVELGPPDDALIEAVLFKLFADRQLTVTSEVLKFMVKRMERSFAAARRLVDLADRAALAARRDITIPLLRSIIETDGIAPSEAG